MQIDSQLKCSTGECLTQPTWSHRPYREHWQGATWRISPAGPAPSSCFGSWWSSALSSLQDDPFAAPTGSTAGTRSAPATTICNYILIGGQALEGSFGITAHFSFVRSLSRFAQLSSCSKILFIWPRLLILPIGSTHPWRHIMSVGEPMVVVEYHDCGHNRRGHHEHDAVEIRAYFWQWEKRAKETC